MSSDLMPTATAPRAVHRRSALLSSGLFFAVFIASISPIRSYDYFWHLATGRWINDHSTLPRSDPFAVASERGPWINGEWLFQIGLYRAYSVAGHQGISYLRGIVVAALFLLVFLLAGSRSQWEPALFLTLIAWAGADHRLTARAETVATFFLVATIWLVSSRMTWWRVIWYVILTAVWINVHPSALLSPIFVLIGLVGRRELRMRIVTLAGALLALLVNPYGREGVLAPIRLMRSINEQTFVNLEWLPSDPVRFPLMYLILLGGCALFVMSRQRMVHLISFLLFCFLGFLAIGHLRNQGFLFAAMPLLLAPLVPRQSGRARLGALVAASALVWVVMLIGRLPLRTGIDERLFPVRAVERLKQIPVGGNIYNPDQFGGFLIWSFYPERRVLTDGRNELYGTYIREYEKARGDSRAWNGLLEKYRIAVAVEEYRRNPVEVIEARSGARHRVAASLVFFPPDQWALVSSDDVAMVFVRRSAIPPEVLSAFELAGPRPDSEPEGARPPAKFPV